MSNEAWRGELPSIRFVTVAEGRAMFDRQARKYLGMSGEEFARRYDAGDLDPCAGDVARVAILLPFWREGVA